MMMGSEARLQHAPSALKHLAQHMGSLQMPKMLDSYALSSASSVSPVSSWIAAAGVSTISAGLVSSVRRLRLRFPPRPTVVTVFAHVLGTGITRGVPVLPVVTGGGGGGYALPVVPGGGGGIALGRGTGRTGGGGLRKIGFGGGG